MGLALTALPELLSPLPIQHFVDSNGNALSGGKLFTYTAGTTTKQTTYTDATGATPNTNPVTLNTRGEAGVWLNPNIVYKFVLSPSTDTDPPTNPIWTVDNISVSGGATSAATDITPQNYGAVGDGFIGDDGSITATQTSFFSTSASFEASDVGQSIGIVGAGTSGATLVTTIATYVAPNEVTLSAAAGTTVSSAHFAFGTDDSAALARFFSSNVGGRASFQDGSVYISTTKQTSQIKNLNANYNPIAFLIGNNTDNCFTVVTPQSLVTSQVTSRAIYRGLYLDALATGLDLHVQNDGSACYYGLIEDYSYRDPHLLSPSASSNQAIENFIVFDWIQRHCGQHGLHVHLVGGGSSTTIYCNETNIYNWEIRGLGQRFGSGTGSTASNAIRFTFDGITTASASKISNFNVYGCNWDADVANSLAGAGIGSVIFANAINTTTYRHVEAFRMYGPGGIESTSGQVAGPPLFLDGSNFTQGDWIESHIDQGIPFQWGIGVPSVFLSTPGDANEYCETSPNRAIVHEALLKRPTDGRSLVSSDVFPNGGFIDPNFKNIGSVYSTLGTLVASGNLVITIPLGLPANPVGNVNNTWQWPVTLILDHKPDSKTVINWAYAEYRIQIAYQVSPGPAAAGVNAILTVNVPSGNPSQTFAPNAVTFALTSSSGSLNDQLQVTIPGGANVGAGSINKLIDVIAYRTSGGGINEANHNYGTPGVQVNTGFGI